jgi:hypothetical protein
MANKNFENYAIAGNNVTLTYDDINDNVTFDVNVDKSDVGLSNVDNTSDVNKPISSATQTALNGKQNTLGYTPLKSVIKSTYALMIADGTPSVDTIYSITNDEDKSYVRSTYLWKSNGNREWIASTPDN